MAWLSRNFIYFYSQGSSIVERCNAVCKGCTEALIRTGWLLDLTRHTDINDIKSYGSGNTYCCWYYLKSKTGAKLLVYYGYYTCSIPAAQLVAPRGIRGSNDSVGDLCLAMIPPGSSSEFGNVLNLENPKFIPDDSTYLTGRAYYYRDVQSKLYSSSTTPMEWVFISDGETIAMFSTKGSGFTDSNVWPCFIIGKLFDVLSDTENDNLPTSKYGTFGLTKNVDTGLPYNYRHTIYHDSNTWESQILTFGNYSDYYSSHASMCFMPDGTRFVYPNSYTKTLATYSPVELSYPNASTSYNHGLRRWTPIYGAICQQNPETGQTVTTGDGFKGVYDTNLMRCTSMYGLSYNQLLDNGNWIYVGGGLMLAWDPSNIVFPCTVNSAIDTRDENNE